MAAVWTVKGGRHGEREDLMLSEGLIGGGWESLGSLESVKSKDELAEAYSAAYPEAAAKAASNHVAQLWSLVSRMQEGDLVVLPVKTTGTIAVGRVAGPYQFRSDLRADTQHTRSVTWIAQDVPRDNFDQDLLYSFGAFLTVGRVRRDQAESRVLRAIDQHPTDGAKQPSPPTRQAVSPAEDDLDEAPDVASLAGEQVRQFISRNFAGHELSRLVSAILEAQGFEVAQSPAGPDQGVDILAGSGPLAWISGGQPGLADRRLDRCGGVFGVADARAPTGLSEFRWPLHGQPAGSLRRGNRL